MLLLSWKSLPFISLSSYVNEMGDVNFPLALKFQNEVNAIKWDPTGNLLASCSDDMTLKVKCTTPGDLG